VGDSQEDFPHSSGVKMRRVQINTASAQEKRMGNELALLKAKMKIVRQMCGVKFLVK